MQRLDGNHVFFTPTFTKTTNQGNPNTHSYLLHSYMTYAQILTTLIYFYLHSSLILRTEIHSTDLKLSVDTVVIRLSQMWTSYDFDNIWSRLALVSEHQQHLWLSHPPWHTQHLCTVFFVVVFFFFFESHSGKKSDKEIWRTVREHFYK